MKTSKRLAGALLCVGVAVLASGCFGPSAAMYAKKCIEKTHELQKTGEQYGKHLAPWFEGKQVDVPTVKTAFATTQKQVAAMKSEVLGYEVPTSDAGKRFATQIKEYMEYEEKVIEQMGNLVTSAIEKENPGSEGLRISTAQQLQAIAKDEDTWAQKLNQAARDCGLKIIGK